MAPPDWRHGLSALGMFCVLLFGLYAILIQPALSTKKVYAEKIVEQHFQLAKFMHAISTIKSTQQTIKQPQQSDQTQQNFLANQAPTIVAANLQEQIKQLINASDGHLVSIHALTLEDDKAPFPKVIIKVHMQANIIALRKIFYQIAHHQPLLFSDNISIQNTRIYSTPTKTTTDLLEVRFDISAYIDTSAP